jgi:hypothetical protein
MPDQLTLEITNEVTEYKGILLMRLRRGSAMQVRLEPDGLSVFFRIVPIGKATQVETDSAWQVASEWQVRSWIQSDSAIGRWLSGSGFVSCAGYAAA